MNLHPVIVHFPVALLSLYSLFELLRFRKLLKQPYWFYVKALLVMIGGIGALAATYTGSTARHVLLSSNLGDKNLNVRAVVSLHQTWSHVSVAVYGLIAAAYVFAWLHRINFFKYLSGSFLKTLWQAVLVYEHVLLGTWLIVIFAFFGLVAITITGALGGLIVYGPNSDPVVHLVYQLFF